MKKVIIATHYTLAKGYKETLAGITGENDSVFAVCAYLNNTGKEDLVESIQNIVEDGNEYFILTDLGFGSVNQAVSQFLSDKIHVITGVNLPFALELILAVKNDLPINITEMIKDARGQLMDVSQMTLISNDEDDE
ncbi:hypothetical protein CRI87_10720 [Liquorilactobacillus satsumensis]|uniref:PTS EIIA type-4 domain-containing protein n=1 Tax=Liquorilactobacillus hordei TaxID=468911 RepID=A0A3S6QSH2_9LACO|nr:MULTISPECIES: hypothetical protein [Liquorilactobacillus]AUJ31044.1 hypothetical protein BSQ49_12455 [Liquorilactobacillus hordei]MCC7667574.1 hypothetical protein [Liquorilactobacillus satsumensis]